MENTGTISHANRFWCRHFDGLPFVPNSKNFTSLTIEIKANFLAMYCAVENIIDTLTQTKLELWKQNYIKVNISLRFKRTFNSTANKICYVFSFSLPTSELSWVRDGRTPLTYLCKQKRISYKTYRFHADARFVPVFSLSFYDIFHVLT